MLAWPRETRCVDAVAVQQNLESIQGDRQRVLTGLKRRGEPYGTDEVDDWARDVLADLDRIWAWAADFAKTSANTPPVPAWVSDVLNDAHPTTAADEREA